MRGLVGGISCPGVGGGGGKKSRSSWSRRRLSRGYAACALQDGSETVTLETSDDASVPSSHAATASRSHHHVQRRVHTARTPESPSTHTSPQVGTKQQTLSRRPGPRLTAWGVRPDPNPSGSHAIWLGARSSYTFWTIELISGPSSRAIFLGERRRNTCSRVIGLIFRRQR